MGKARVTVNIDEALKVQLHIDAVKKKTTMSEIVERLVADYLHNNTQEQPAGNKEKQR